MSLDKNFQKKSGVSLWQRFSSIKKFIELIAKTSFCGSIKYILYLGCNIEQAYKNIIKKGQLTTIKSGEDKNLKLKSRRKIYIFIVKFSWLVYEKFNSPLIYRLFRNVKHRLDI